MCVVYNDCKLPTTIYIALHILYLCLIYRVSKGVLYMIAQSETERLLGPNARIVPASSQPALVSDPDRSRWRLVGYFSPPSYTVTQKNIITPTIKPTPKQTTPIPLEQQQRYATPPSSTPTQQPKKLIIPTPTTTSMAQNIIRNTMYGSGSLSSSNVHGNSVASNISRALKTQGLPSNVTSSLTAAQNKVRQAMLPSTSSSQRSSLFASAQKDLITAHASMGNRRI